MANPFAQADKNFVMPNRKVDVPDLGTVEKEKPAAEPVKETAPVKTEVKKTETKREVPAKTEKPAAKTEEKEVKVNFGAGADLLKSLAKNKPVYKTYSFYLEEDVNKALEKLAKQNKVNKSQLLNELLKNILLG